MHALARRTLVLGVGPEFTLLGADGAVLGQGSFPAEAEAADLVVVSDYELLAHPNLLDYSTSGAVGLMPPRRARGTTARLLAARESEGLAIIDKEALRALTPYLRLRYELTGMLEQTRARIHRALGEAAPDYLALLSRDGRIPPDLMPVLREYPTLGLLGRTGLLQVTRLLETTLGAANRQLIDQLLSLRRSWLEAHPSGGDEGGFAETAIPDAVELHALILRQRADCDAQIYRVAAKEHGDALAIGGRAPLALLAYPPRAEGSGSAPDLRTPFARHLDAVAARAALEHEPRRAFEEHRRARAGDDAAALVPADLLALETAGQLLALSSGNHLDAIRSRSVSESLFLSGELPRFGDDERLGRIRADALLAMAVTEAIAIDPLTGFSSLREAIDQVRGTASPELLTEAYGLFVLLCVFFGERSGYERSIRELHSLIDAHGGSGASRACTDLAEFFLAAARPGTPPDGLAALGSAADTHTAGTPYRFYYNYVLMLSAYVTKEVELGLLAYNDIKREGLASRFNRRFARLARLSYGILLSARGDFAGAERELAAHASSSDSSGNGVDDAIVQLYRLRLELARGQHHDAFIQTLPDGPLGESQLQSVHLRRYIPGSLIARGTALMREGSVDRAHEVFGRAVQQAILADEWLSLLCGETPEFRAWFEGLDRDALPPGLTVETYDAILAKPIFLSATIPSLTEQQSRVLQLLAQGRSTASIASELHISSNTLKTHLRKLYERLGVHSREQAVLHAESYGLFL